MDWDAYEKQTGQKRPPWIDGVGNINYSWGGKPDPAPRNGDKIRALMNMPQVSPASMRGGLMPQPQAPGIINPWRPQTPGLAWVQAGQQLRPQTGY